MLALPLSGPVVHRLRPARTVLFSAALSMLALIGIGIGGAGLAGGVMLLVPSLFAAGVGIGMWDVAMNVEGAEVERGVGRAIMPWFHAAFSLGTVGGALTGALAAALALPLPVHLSLVAVLSLATVVVALRRFLPVAEAADAERDGGSTANRGSTAIGVGASAVRAPEPCRLGESHGRCLVGLLALGMALAEGSANDWLALGLVDGYGLGNAAGAVGLGLFLCAMTASRLAGPRLLARFGRVPVLRGGALLVLAGVLVYVGAAQRVEPGPVRDNLGPLVWPASRSWPGAAVPLWGSRWR